MEYIVRDYQPKKLFNIFEELCKIPHGSGNEHAVALFVAKYASDRGLEHFIDDVGNVFVRKPASKGLENMPSVLLQGHMDMVCEKEALSDHDFLRDGLELYIDNGYLSACNTTLGGDDGIAVAMMLALLDEQTCALECLFTVEEETGLAGAKSFDCSHIRSRYMINLDSEEEDTVTVGCAGGVRSDVVIPIRSVENTRPCFRITVGGLAGGHSGADIDKGRTSAAVVMGRLLPYLDEEFGISLSTLVCDGKDNAIARACSATLALDCRGGKELPRLLKAFESEIKKELCMEDEGFFIECEEVSAAATVADRESTLALVRFLGTVRTGVLKMSNHINGLVEYSRNLGIIETCEGEVRFTLSSRSSLEAQLDSSCREIDMAAELAGGNAEHYSRYPGWEYCPESLLRERYLTAYEALFGKRPSVGVIHAGLECGLIGSRVEGLDIISIGPNMKDIHTPAERLELASCERIWRVLIKVLGGE